MSDWNNRLQARIEARKAPGLNGNGKHHESAPTKKPESSTSVPVILTMSSVTPLNVQWLWPTRIPRGAITLLDGDPGLGKSTATTDIAARVTRGLAMPPAGGPCEGCEPGNVLLLSAEDDPARTIRPRLDAAEADTDRVFFLEGIKHGDDTIPPILPWDLDVLEATVVERAVKLVVVDPFVAFLDSKVDSHNDADIRRVMHRLKMLAERTGAAIVLIRHLNKLAGGPAMYRGGGSIGISGAARSVLLVGKDPNDSKRMVIASVKSNLGPTPKSVAYYLEPAGNVARIAWAGECDLTADDIVVCSAGARPKRAERCADAMQEFLARGPMKVSDLEDQLAALGHSERSIKAARKTLGTRPFKSSFDGSWMIDLPVMVVPMEGADEGEHEGEHSPL